MVERIALEETVSNEGVEYEIEYEAEGGLVVVFGSTTVELLYLDEDEGTLDGIILFVLLLMIKGTELELLLAMILPVLTLFVFILLFVFTVAAGKESFELDFTIVFVRKLFDPFAVLFVEIANGRLFVEWLLPMLWGDKGEDCDEDIPVPFTDVC